MSIWSSIKGFFKKVVDKLTGADKRREEEERRKQEEEERKRKEEELRKKEEELKKKEEELKRREEELKRQEEERRRKEEEEARRREEEVKKSIENIEKNLKELNERREKQAEEIKKFSEEMKRIEENLQNIYDFVEKMRQDIQKMKRDWIIDRGGEKTRKVYVIYYICQGDCYDENGRRIPFDECKKKAEPHVFNFYLRRDTAERHLKAEQEYNKNCEYWIEELEMTQEEIEVFREMLSKKY